MAFARLLTPVFCALLLGAIVPAAQALQLGETQAEIVARHGVPGAEDRGKRLAIYFWEGWSAQLEFHDDRVRKITYRRAELLQEAEIQALLQSNGGANRWREVSPDGARLRDWRRDDGATASCDGGRPVSIVFQGGRTPSAATAKAPKSATAEIGPKVVVATPAPTPAPNFPKLLGTADPTPEAPTEDAPTASTPEPAEAPEPIVSQPASTAQDDPLATKPRPALRVTVGPAEKQTPAPVPTAAPEVELPVASGTGWLIGLLAAVGAGIGAGLYFYKRQHHFPGRANSRSTTRGGSDGALKPAGIFDQLRGDQFELLVGEMFRREGYTVELSAATALDDTIDLTLRRDGETILVECRHWQVTRVTARELREFYGAMTACGAPRGIFVTTGTFTRDACEFAEGKGLELMDRTALEECVTICARPGENFFDVASWVDEFAAHARIFDPECPVCQGTMVIRNSPTGGSAFWSCRQHPRCPGRREPRRDLLAASAAR